VRLFRSFRRMEWLTRRFHNGEDHELRRADLALCPGPPPMPWQRRGLPDALPGRREESRHAGPTASPGAAVAALPKSAFHMRVVWRQSGRGTATFRHALPGVPLRCKRSGRTTSSMFSASHVDSQRGASEGLVWGEKLSLSLSLSLPPSPRARDYAAWPTSRTARQWLRARDYAARPTSRTARQWWPGGAMRSTTLHEIRPRQWWPGGAMRSTPLHEIRPLIQKLFIHQEVEVVGCSAKQLRRKSRRLSGRVRR